MSGLLREGFLVVTRSVHQWLYFLFTMTAAKKRQKKPPEPHWNLLVQTWFRFCKLFFKCEPSFDGSAPRDLKTIIIQLRERCEKSGHKWTENESTQRLWLFLKGAYDVPWLRDHWTLSNINRQKDTIFFNAAQNALAQSHPSE